MKVYVIRHGQSETNLQHKWTGWADVTLTEKGKNDAKRAGEILKGVSFDKVFASDLSRAIDTAKNALPDCNPEISPLLREINVGTLAGNPLDCITDEDRIQIAQDGYVAFDGESSEEFYARINEFKASLEKLDCENVAVFSHAGWLRAMLDSVVGVKLPRKNIICDNCTVAIYEYDKANGWRLHSWINI